MYGTAWERRNISCIPYHEWVKNLSDEITVNSSTCPLEKGIEAKTESKHVVQGLRANSSGTDTRVESLDCSIELTPPGPMWARDPYNLNGKGHNLPEALEL